MEDWGRVELETEQEDDPTALGPGQSRPSFLSDTTGGGGCEKVGKMMRSAKAKGRVWQATCLNLDRMCFNVVLVVSCACKVERIRTRSASRLEGRTGGLQSSNVSC